MMDWVIVIPARYASSRLPGKPLRLLTDKTMIEHVYRRAERCGAKEVVVATDDQRILEHVRVFGGCAEMTGTHASGSDRIAELASRLGWRDDRIIVNLQGDEPLIAPENILQVAQCLQDHPEADIATLAEPVSADQVHNPHIVKVVPDQHGRALYFSRAPVLFPCSHRGRIGAAMGHIGLYAYRAHSLRRFTGLPRAPMEEAESLEQLRALYHGMSIQVDLAQVESGKGVDTEEDLRHARDTLAQLAPRYH